MQEKGISMVLISPCKQTTKRKMIFAKTYCGLVTLTAFNDVLIPLAGNVYHRLTNTTGNHRHATLDGGLIRRRQLVRSDRGDGVHVGLRFVWKAETVTFEGHAFLRAALRTDRIASAVRAIRDVLVLQQWLPLALLAVSHAE